MSPEIFGWKRNAVTRTADMLRQKEEENIPDYPLFTHDDIDRCARRMVGGARYSRR